MSRTLPFSKIIFEPSDPYLATPSKRFVLDSADGIEGIKCYVNDFQGSFEQNITTLGNKLLIELNRLPVSGRLRFNCTKVDQGVY